MNKIAIIDLDSMVFSIGYSKDREKTKGELVDSTNMIMNSILSSTEATHYLAYIKGKNTISNRKLFCEDYKANRTSKQPDYWKFVKNYLIKEWKAIEVNNMEVDDAVNITRINLNDSFICCIDSDLLGTEGTRYNWRKKEWITTSIEQERCNFWFSMICGTHNGIKGIPGKGIKYVEKLYEENLGTPIEALIFNEYIQYFNEPKGIEEFYKNYNCIKLLKENKDFVIPEPIKYIDELQSKVEEGE